MIFRQFSGLRAREKRIVSGKGSVAPTMEFTYSLTGIVFLLGLLALEDSWC